LKVQFLLPGGSAPLIELPLTNSIITTTTITSTITTKTTTKTKKTTHIFVRLLNRFSQKVQFIFPGGGAPLV
jgi:hypothetical protein